MSTSSKGRAAIVTVQSFAGRGEFPVLVVGETPKRFRCRFERAGLGWHAGQVYLVPKRAVRFTQVSRRSGS